MTFYQHSINFFSKNVILNSFAHSVGGFGLAIVLQNYFQGDPFIAVEIGWFFIAISAGIHVWSLFGK